MCILKKTCGNTLNDVVYGAQTQISWQQAICYFSTTNQKENSKIKMDIFSWPDLTKDSTHVGDFMKAKSI